MKEEGECECKGEEGLKGLQPVQASLLSLPHQRWVLDEVAGKKLCGHDAGSHAVDPDALWPQLC